MQVIFLTFWILLTALVRALGVGTWMSALNVNIRDVRVRSCRLLIQLWLFVSSVISRHPPSRRKWRWL
jgi:ABC-type polysaccharide/polyol phosphate export permease